MRAALDLHVFILPFPTPGHMIPMVDFAKILSARNVKVTVVTTTAHAPLIRPTIDRSPNSIRLLTLHLPPSVENLISLPSVGLTPDFVRTINSLEQPFRNLLDEHHPDVIISDLFYPWTADLGVTRLAFHGASAFGTIVGSTICALKLHETVGDDNEPFVVPGIPHHVEMTRSKLMEGITNPDELITQMGKSFQRSYGMIMNSFYELEPGYARMMSCKLWHVGPVSLCNRVVADNAVRGGRAEDFDRCLKWLDRRKPGSVLYVCFGSLGKFTSTQLHEIAAGLQASDHPFVWVTTSFGDNADRVLETLEKKGLIIEGWAPQMLILNHEAVGGFMTHCGWNSCLEGVSAGKPMIAWPLFAEQFFNEAQVVDVLKIGVSVGSKVCSTDEAKRTMVKSDEVEKAAKELMGSGEEADERRKRAKEAAEMAKKAVEEGGSSYNDISGLIREMMDVKAGAKVEEREMMQDRKNRAEKKMCR